MRFPSAVGRETNVQVTFFRPDVRAHAGIGALRRARRRAEKC